MRRGAEMPSRGQILSAVERLIEEANDLPDRMMNPGPSDWPDATRCSEEGEYPGSLLRFLLAAAITTVPCEWAERDE
jgi:hypothetical protein